MYLISVKIQESKKWKEKKNYKERKNLKYIIIVRDFNNRISINDRTSRSGVSNGKDLKNPIELA